MQFCQICGNESDYKYSCCPYCGSDQKGVEHNQSKPPKRKFYQKTINLEQGLPTVQQALGRLEQELQTAGLEQIRVLTLIHGYGSTGKGGAIRLECRKTLEYLHSKGDVAEVIYGEDFHRRNRSVKHLLSRFPDLSRHPHLNHNNKGISLVVFS
jgi:hypothetical protein